MLNPPECTQDPNKEKIYTIEFSKMGLIHVTGQHTPVGKEIDFSGVANPPHRDSCSLESLYDITHTNPGTEALLGPPLHLEPCDISLGLEEGRDSVLTLEALDRHLEVITKSAAIG